MILIKAKGEWAYHLKEIHRFHLKKKKSEFVYKTLKVLETIFKFLLEFKNKKLPI